MSGKYYSFTYAPNKVDLTLDLPTRPPKKSSSSTGTSSGKQSSSTTSSSSGSKDPGSGSTKLVTLTKKN